jgi:hypothetical protein
MRSKKGEKQITDFYSGLGFESFVFLGGRDRDSRSRKTSQGIAQHRERFRLFLVTIAHAE